VSRILERETHIVEARLPFTQYAQKRKHIYYSLREYSLRQNTVCPLERIRQTYVLQWARSGRVQEVLYEAQAIRVLSPGRKSWV
jgi:hypothetical protein